jgi:hypothetical protein
VVRKGCEVAKSSARLVRCADDFVATFARKRDA